MDHFKKILQDTERKQARIYGFALWYFIEFHSGGLRFGCRQEYWLPWLNGFRGCPLSPGQMIGLYFDCFRPNLPK